MSDEVENTQNHPAVKRPYQPPTLRVYGAIQDLTRGSASLGTNNDTRGPANDVKTH